MRNQYKEMSPDELRDVASAALWAHTHKHEMGLDVSFEVSDTSWKCQFSTMTLEQLDEEAKKIAIALMHQVEVEKTKKWYQRILTPNLKVSLIVVSVVLLFVVIASFAAS